MRHNITFPRKGRTYSLHKISHYGFKSMNAKRGMSKGVTCRPKLDFAKSNLLGQKFALNQRVKSLEQRLAEKEKMLENKTARLQYAIQARACQSKRKCIIEVLLHSLPQVPRPSNCFMSPYRIGQAPNA